jgi:UDP-glucose 4-epimerase
MVFDKLERGENPQIFGDDYPTKDGTCVRDYIHVLDLSDAHIKALDYLDSPQKYDVFNVGTGFGTSVLEIINAIKKVTGVNFTPDVMPRRAGDPAVLIGSPERIEKEFKWKAKFGIDDIIKTAWAAWRYDHEST